MLFETDEQYAAFEELLFEETQKFDVRLLAYSAMPTHWHLVVWLREDVTRFPEFMKSFTQEHALRWHADHGSLGTGHVYQSRYKSFHVQSETRVPSVCRYVERNALRRNLVVNAEAWRWSSLWRWCNHCHRPFVSEWPVPRPSDWLEYVNRPLTHGELASAGLPLV